VLTGDGGGNGGDLKERGCQWLFAPGTGGSGGGYSDGSADMGGRDQSREEMEKKQKAHK